MPVDRSLPGVPHGAAPACKGERSALASTSPVTKRLLLGTTVLASASLFVASPGAAEEGIKLGLGGYMNNFFGIGDVDADDGTDFAPTGIFSDGEVSFQGETTLDNGLTFGAVIELEAFGDTANTIDDNYGYIDGGFGRLVFGSTNTAAYLMHYASPSVGAPINSGWVTSFVPVPSGHDAAFQTTALSTYIDIGDGENTLTYYTPRLYGFQIGVSYQPAVVYSGNGKDFPVYADEAVDYNNGLALGVNFVETLGSVDVALAAGYRRADAPDGAIGTTADPDDIQQLSFGANIAFAGFTVGGSYANEIDGLVSAADVSTEGQSYDFGVTYSTGPWTFGAAYFHGEIEAELAVPGEDEMDAIRGAVAYEVAPGITASGSVLYADWNSETGNDTDGIAGIFGLAFGF